MDNSLEKQLLQAFKHIESLITKPAESLDDPDERQAEFQRRLGRTRRLMGYLGDPQEDIDIIHVGGTSGKGSIAILCESMLKAQGLRIGTHISPYLQTPLEKARVDSQLIAPSAAIALSDAVMTAVEKMQKKEPHYGKPHYAEAWLGVALKYFCDEACDAGVIEVGMGGRYDASNIVTPRVSVISTVHYDHVRVLGETLAEIAFHKAGIIKGGVPVVVGQVGPEASAVIEDEAALRGSELVRVGKEVTYEPLELNSDGGRFNYRGLNLSLENLQCGLLGQHQFLNAATALAALEVYAARSGIKLDEPAIRQGLADAHFAGRLEVMERNPTVVLDGAHNEEKINALLNAIPEVFDYERLILVLGMLEAKQVEPIMERLAGLADVMVTTSPTVKGKPALSAKELAAIATLTGADNVFADDVPLDALVRAISLAKPGDLVLATGSLYLIGTIRAHWHDMESIIDQRTMFPNGFPR